MSTRKSERIVSKKRKLNPNCYFDILPDELVMRIFHSLNIANYKSIINLDLVCKRWKDIIDTEYFWNCLLNRYFISGNHEQSRTVFKDCITNCLATQIKDIFEPYTPSSSQDNIEEIQDYVCKRLFLACRYGYDQYYENHVLLLKNSIKNIKQNNNEHGFCMPCILNRQYKTLDYPKGVFLLLLASMYDHINMIQILIRDGANVNYVVPECNIGAIYGASINNKANAIRVLHKYGANLNLVISDQVSPLQIAVKMNNKEAVTVLLELGADITYANNTGMDAFYICITEGFVEIAKLIYRYLTKDNKFDINKILNNNATYLSLATKFNRIDMIEYLIGIGANINQRLLDRSTALHVAAHISQPDTIKYLISKGADVNAEANNHITPLFVALLRKEIEVAKLLLDNGANINAKYENGAGVIQIVTKDGNVNLLESILPYFPRPHKKLLDSARNDGITPLIYASHQGHIDMCKYLIECQVDVNKQESRGISSLIIASEKGHTEVVEILILAGANTDLADNYGVTALYSACSSGNNVIVELLLKTCSNVNICKISDGLTPLHLAVRNNNYIVAEMLLDHDANVNIKCKLGKSPLDYSLKSDLELNSISDMTRLLMKHGGEL